MNQYTNFAYVYDTFMDNIPYDEWAEYVVNLLQEYNISNCTIAELGCGTGSFTMRLADYGYKVAGIDNSASMLDVAIDKLIPEYRRRILYTLQDMRDFILKRPVSAIVSVCDSMNYILQSEDLKKVFRQVHENLHPGGIFIFDLKTPFFYSEILGDSTIADNYENSSFIWENSYNPKSRINKYRLSIFVRERKNHYVRHREIHRQRAYEIAEMQDLLQNSGLNLLQVYDAFTKDAPHKKSERVYFIVQKGF